MHLNLFIYPGGHHEAGWRHPSASPGDILDLEAYGRLARLAEESKFDALFLADGLALADNIAHATPIRLEPLTWASALAALTERIGLICTASTTYTEPFNLARQFAALDHLSKGRAG